MNSKMILADSIQKIRTITEKDIMVVASPNLYLVQRTKGEIIQTELLGSELYQFKQNFKFDWKLLNENRTINGYKCKKAIANFGGRSWIAWYTPEIPLLAGPYIFCGLPGLIFELTDLEKVFYFTVSSVKKGMFLTNPDIANYFVKDEGVFIKPINVNNFFKLRTKFNTLSLNDQIRYMTRSRESPSEGIGITTLQGEQVPTNRPGRVLNFIERFE